MVYLILLLVLFFPLTVQADYGTGQQWLEKLNSPMTEDKIDAKVMVGNILFAWEGKSHCKPSLATLGQAVAITKKFLDENPQFWHEEVSNLIGAALGIAWPCPIQDKDRR